MSESLAGKTILITGGARRVGKIFALACARAGADVVIHHGHSAEDAEATRAEIAAMGRRAWVIEADLNDPAAAGNLVWSVNESTLLRGCSGAQGHCKWPGAGSDPSAGRWGAKPDLLKSIPVGRWAEEQEVEQALLFALTGPAYITGEIIHVDGGRHLV